MKNIGNTGYTKLILAIQSQGIKKKFAQNRVVITFQFELVYKNVCSQKRTFFNVTSTPAT